MNMLLSGAQGKEKSVAVKKAFIKVVNKTFTVHRTPHSTSTFL